MPPSIPDLDGYRADAGRYLEAPGPAADAAFAHLFSAADVAGLEAYDGGDPRRMRALARFAAEGYLRLASADEMAGIHELLRAPLVAGGRDGAVTLGEVDALLAAEPDRERRRELQGARLRALDQHLRSPMSDAALRRADAARELGAASAAELVARAGGLDLAATADDAVRILDGTDDIAARSLDRVARAALGAPASALDAADLPRLTRAPNLEADLPPRGRRGGRRAHPRGDGQPRRRRAGVVRGGRGRQPWRRSARPAVPWPGRASRPGCPWSRACWETPRWSWRTPP